MRYILWIFLKFKKGLHSVLQSAVWALLPLRCTVAHGELEVEGEIYEWSIVIMNLFDTAILTHYFPPPQLVIRVPLRISELGLTLYLSHCSYNAQAIFVRLAFELGLKIVSTLTTLGRTKICLTQFNNKVLKKFSFYDCYLQVCLNLSISFWHFLFQLYEVGLPHLRFGL